MLTTNMLAFSRMDISSLSDTMASAYREGERG
jgi:hypothetical protein